MKTGDELRKRLNWTNSSISAVHCRNVNNVRMSKVDFPFNREYPWTSVVYIWDPLPQLSMEKEGSLSRRTQHIMSLHEFLCFHFLSTFSAFLFPLCRSDGWRGPPIQQVWERVKQLYWRSSTGCPSILARSDARFSRKLQCSRMILFRQKSPCHTFHIMPNLIETKNNFFCLPIPDVDAVCVLSDVEACFKTFFGLLKFNYELSLFNIVVWYQTLHFVHTVLIYETQKSDCTANVPTYE